MISEQQQSIRDLPIDSLRLDAKNSRLPEKMSEDEQLKLIEFVANEYDAITIARSIALHGFFPSEPLIAVPAGQEFVVLEGNRRLAALKILQDESLRMELDLDDAEEWNELAENAEILEIVPVVVADNRRSVAPIVGYRHISGIEPWEPWAKARFIATLLEDEGLGFDDVSDEVGENRNEIKSHYRNFKIIKRARDSFNVSTDRAENMFGVFTRAMSSLPLRMHIGAPAPNEVQKEGDIISNESKDKLEELLLWLFGTKEQDAVITESRNITMLGTVVGSEDGLAVLRETRNLEEAYIAAGGLRERLLRRLNQAITNLEAAESDVHEYSQDQEVQAMLERCRVAINDLIASAGLEGANSNASTKNQTAI